MKINRVALTPLEANWFGRNVLSMLQLLERSEGKNPGVLERTTYKILNGLRSQAEEAQATVKAFGEEEQYEVDLTLSKKQKSVLKELVGSVQKSLVERVIPEYEKRGESHKDYKFKATLKAEFLENLVRKFK